MSRINETGFQPFDDTYKLRQVFFQLSRALSYFVKLPFDAMTSFRMAKEASRNGEAQHWLHDDVIKWKPFPRYWPFVQGIHRSPVNSPHKGQWLGAMMFSLICVWKNGWVNNREAGDLKRYRAHHDVMVMSSFVLVYWRHDDDKRESMFLFDQMGRVITDYDSPMINIFLS